MKVIEGNYNEKETTETKKVSVEGSRKTLSYIFKPELVSIAKNKIEVMSGDSEDNDFVILEGTQKEIEEIAVKMGWTRFIGWNDNYLAIPQIGLQIKHKIDKTLYTITGINSSLVQICSRRGILHKISEIDLINDYKRI